MVMILLIAMLLNQSKVSFFSFSWYCVLAACFLDRGVWISRGGGCLSGLGREAPSRLLPPGVKREAPNFMVSRTVKMWGRSGGDSCVLLVSRRPELGGGRSVTVSFSEVIWERVQYLLPVLDREWVVSWLARSWLVRRSILMKVVWMSSLAAVMVKVGSDSVWVDGGGGWLSGFPRMVVGFIGGGFGDGCRRLLLGGGETSELPPMTVNGKWTPVTAGIAAQLVSTRMGSVGNGLGQPFGPARAF